MTNTNSGPRFFINASNVHQGGGAVLLRTLLEAGFSDAPMTVCVDERMVCAEEGYAGVQLVPVRRSLIQRVKYDRWIARQARPGDVILSFGNLPPLFSSAAWSVCFIQNRYLIEPRDLSGFSAFVRARIAIERAWLKYAARHCDAFSVQTPTMRDLLRQTGWSRDRPIHVMPFGAHYTGYPRRLDAEAVPVKPADSFRFIYVASGDPHKNHRILVKAWCKLAEEGVRPSLVLTLDGNHYGELLAWVEQCACDSGLAIENIGVVSHADVCRQYQLADALVYPSDMESFGLPLVEARLAGLPVLAPERDYVRDLVDPEQTFDPCSATSIARALLRFMGCSPRSQEIGDGAHFLTHLWSMRGRG
jgi:glycosyltransferase involved in cell wall biosynthesis